MNDFITQVFILVLAVAAITVLWSLFGERLKDWRAPAVKPPIKREGSGGFGQPYEDDRIGTVQMPVWKVSYKNGRGQVETDIILDKSGIFAIGKGKGCNLVITGSEYVGRIHAIVTKDMDGYYLLDNDSVNGTFLRGTTERQDEIIITDGLKVKLANVELTFKKMDLSYGDDGLAVPEPHRRRRPPPAVATRTS